MILHHTCEDAMINDDKNKFTLCELVQHMEDSIHKKINMNNYSELCGHLCFSLMEFRKVYNESGIDELIKMAALCCRSISELSDPDKQLLWIDVIKKLEQWINVLYYDYDNYRVMGCGFITEFKIEPALNNFLTGLGKNKIYINELYSLAADAIILADHLKQESGEELIKKANEILHKVA